jgi:ATP-dependent DNA ligase
MRQGICDVYDLLEQVAATRSRNDKLALLEQGKFNSNLSSAFLYALDPYTQFYMRKLPAYVATGDKGLDWFFEQLSQFSNREVTGHAAQDKMSEVLSQLTPEAASVAERIVKKDLRCGVQESTVNKVWKGLIPTYPCLLGKPYDEKTIKNIQWPAFGQLKADGMRANVHVEFIDGRGCVVSVYGRSGRMVDLLGNFDNPFSMLGEAYGRSAVFDGELVLVEDDGSIMSRKKGNGILSKAIKGTISEDEASRVRMRIWDVIPLEKFRAYKDTTPYSVRFSTVKDLVEANPADQYEIIETRTLENFDAANDYFGDALEMGEEGIMLKNSSGIWQNKRSPDLLKFKAEKDCDLEIVEWIEGTGKYQGMLGALVGKTSDGMLYVSVGSGFTDEERKTITPDVVGSIMAVKFNEVIDARGKNRWGVDWSLFLPRFIEIRTDKTVADDFATVWDL